MTAAIGRTASGSFLMSQDPMMSASQVAAPVFEVPPIRTARLVLLNVEPSEMSRSHLEVYAKDLKGSLGSAKHVDSRDLIIEGAHAQLIVQGIYSAKQSQSLYARENMKKTDRTMLFPEGKGRHLTEK
jgi:hypothetical protein